MAGDFGGPVFWGQGEVLAVFLKRNSGKKNHKSGGR